MARMAPSPCTHTVISSPIGGAWKSLLTVDNQGATSTSDMVRALRNRSIRINGHQIHGVVTKLLPTTPSGCESALAISIQIAA
jgi:hypothetical protein